MDSHIWRLLRGAGSGGGGALGSTGGGGGGGGELQAQGGACGSRFEKMKYVLVTGGVVSGLGKGVTASSVGVVLKACGLRVTSIKIGTIFLA